MVQIVSYFRALAHVLPCLVYNDSAHGTVLIMVGMALNRKCLCTLRVLWFYSDTENDVRFSIMLSIIFIYTYLTL